MTSTHNPLIAPLIQSFFTQHLQLHKRVSPQTVACYRDTFRLLFQFIKERTGREPAAFRIADLAAEVILSFLDHLEEQRHNSARSRNIRLAAIRTFFRWVALREPEQVDLATRVLAIPVKRTEKRIVQGLTREEMEAMLNAPDPSTRQGRRDHALLSTLYNSGARISEITGLRRHQVRFGASAFLQLHGKGRKERTVPLCRRLPAHCRSGFASWVANLKSSHSQVFVGHSSRPKGPIRFCSVPSERRRSSARLCAIGTYLRTRFGTRPPCICSNQAWISPLSLYGWGMRVSRPPIFIWRRI